MRRIPALALLKIANLVGDENMKKNANRYAKVINYLPYIDKFLLLNPGKSLVVMRDNH
jgi:hypothetical protein